MAKIVKCIQDGSSRGVDYRKIFTIDFDFLMDVNEKYNKMESDEFEEYCEDLWTADEITFVQHELLHAIWNNFHQDGVDFNDIVSALQSNDGFVVHEEQFSIAVGRTYLKAMAAVLWDDENKADIMLEEWD